MERDSANPKVVISTGTIFRLLLVVLFFVFLYFMRDLLLVLLTAIVIASAVEPLVKFLAQYHVARIPAVLATYLGLSVIVVGIVYSFLPLLLDDLSNFLTTAPRYVDTVALWNPVGEGELPPGAVRELSEGIGKSKNLVTRFVLPSAGVADTGLGRSSFQEIVASFQRAFSSFSGGFLQTLSVIFGGILSFILIVVLSFYLSVQENGINTFLRVITPIRHEKYVVDLWRRSQEKIGRWMQGQLLLGVLVGVLVFLGLTVLGVRNALLFAVVAAVFEIIPVFGPILSAIPPILTAFSQDGVTLALLTTGLFIIIQQFENHLVYPLVVRKIVGVSPIVVILALIIGAKLAGFLGILLSVPVATVLMEYFNELERRKVAFGQSSA